MQTILVLLCNLRRVLEPDPQRFTSLNELESCEELLSKTLSIIEQRKVIGFLLFFLSVFLATDI